MKKLKCIELKVPQMGEGLCEVKLISFLKNPGDSIKEDEIIYEMETDKSIVSVESAHQGKLVKWVVEEGAVVEVGSTLAILEIFEETPAEILISSTKTECIRDEKLRSIPPRIRSYCKANGLSTSEMLEIPVLNKKLTQEDVDCYLSNQEKKSTELLRSNPVKNFSKKHVQDTYREFSLSQQQKMLIQRFRRSQERVIPATLVSVVEMDKLDRAAHALIDQSFPNSECGFISEFHVFAFCIAQVCARFPKFRSTLTNEYDVREYESVNLGFAVHREKGEFRIAVIGSADKLEFAEFIKAVQEGVQKAYQEENQFKEIPQVLLTYLGRNGIVSGTPILVDPSVAILFLGCTYSNENKHIANLSLTFDHRLINGMDAADFLQGVSDIIDELSMQNVEKTVQTNLPSSVAVPGFKLETAVQQLLLNKISMILNSTICEIGIDRHFFELGIDSISLMVLCHKLNTHLGLRLTPAVIFRHSTINSLSGYLVQNYRSMIELHLEEDLSSPQKETVVTDNQDSIAEVYGEYSPLSIGQERLWFIHELDPHSNAYNIGIAIRIEGELDLEWLFQSFEAALNRHESLRMVFSKIDGEPRIRIVPKCSMTRRIKTIPQPLSDLQTFIKEEFKRETDQPFNLEQGPLFRHLILNVNSNLNVFILVMPHIIADGWSFSILMKEIALGYNALIKNMPLPSLNLETAVQDNKVKQAQTYLDFILQQRKWIQEDTQEKLLNYWKGKLVDLMPLDFAINRSRFNHSPVISEYEFTLPKGLSRLIRELILKENISLFTCLFSAFCILLHRYSGKSDFAVAVPAFGRGQDDFKDVFGFFVNILPLRVNVNNKMSFRELTDQVKETLGEALAHQDVPLMQLINELNLPRNLNDESLFQVAFVLQHFEPIPEQFDHLRVNLQECEAGRLPCDITLEVYSYFEDFKILFKYNTDLYRDSCMIKRMASLWVELLEGIILSPNQQVDRLPFLPKEDINQLRQWGHFYLPARIMTSLNNKCIHQLFEESVAAFPHRIAIAHEKDELTYENLNARSNQVGRYLQTFGVGPEVRVGIGLPRGIDLVVGLLGVFKAGGAYVPLDPSYPKERLDYIIADAGVELIITSNLIKEVFSGYHGNVIYLDQPEAYAEQPASNFENSSCPNNLAYVIYTSGSTGRPKGVVCDQRGMINRLSWAWKTYPFGENETCCLQSSIGFVDSTWDIFGTLLAGARLALYNHEVSVNVEDLCYQCSDSHVTRITLVPSFLKELIRLARMDTNLLKAFKTIRHLEVTGEFFDPALAAKFAQLFGHDITFLDCYGATEATSVIYKDFKKHGCQTLILSNTQIYLLDRELNPVPIGVTGEIYVGGVGLARGYLNRADLTAEKFVPNPFPSKRNEPDGQNLRLYRTGDLARYLPDGNIEFMGRFDHQVKIRGFRIELGEIESVLQSVSDVRQAVAISCEGEEGLKRLVGYVAAAVEEEEELVERCLRCCESQLPAYMVPSQIIILPKLPLNSNGKIDRNALPVPKNRDGFREGYESPKGLIEEQLGKLWSDLLGIEHIGRRDDFFRLGGHSLLATRLVSRLRDLYKIEVPLKAIFQHSQLMSLASYLNQETAVEDDKMMQNFESESLPLGPDHSQKVKAAPIESDYGSKDCVNLLSSTAVSRLKQAHLSEGILPPINCLLDRFQPQLLSFSQQRLWFMEQLLPNTGLYNIPLQWRIKGPLHVEALKRALNAMKERHEVLQTCIIAKEGIGYSKIEPSKKGFLLYEISLESLTGSSQERTIEKYLKKEAKYSFSFESGDLCHALLLRLSNDEFILALAFHHIIFDGWSLSIFCRELSSYYNSYVRNENVELPDLPIQYMDFSVWQRGWLQGDVLSKQLNYWQKQLKGFEHLDLPLDKPREKKRDYQGGYYSLQLSKNLLNKLNAFSKSNEVTLFMTLLAAFQGLLSRYTGQSDIIVGTPIANRKVSEIEGLIGFFVNTLVLRTNCDVNKNFIAMLKQVEETTLSAYGHQDIPFEQLVEHLQIPRDLGRHPLFQIMFILKNLENSQLIFTDLMIQPLPRADNIASKFDITLHAVENDQGLLIEVEYAKDLFFHDTIERFAEHYVLFLSSAVAQPNLRLSEISLLTENERLQLVRWNATHHDYPNKLCVSRLFEEAVEAHPFYPAVVYEGEALTYQQLNHRTNQLAYHLRSLGVGPETLVAISLDRSLNMIVGILGILKAGGAYVPLDPAYPLERLEFILQETKAPVLLMHSSLKNLFTDYSGIVVAFDQDAAILQQYPVKNLSSFASPDNLAYVIYTSGSTGKPKGVQVVHEGLVSFLSDMKERTGIVKEDVLLSATSMLFDIFGLELYLPLITGAKLIIIPQKFARDGEAILHLIQQEKVTIMQATPTTWHMLLEAGWVGERGFKILHGGEALSDKLRKSFQKMDVYAWNLYGPTETTIWSTAIDITHGHSHSSKTREDFEAGKICKYFENLPQKSSLIGVPIWNTRIYILDHALNHVPIGVTGEIYIGGVGLARGYLNNADLTAEKFIPNPFIQHEDGEDRHHLRLYRTGDLGRYLSDGSIEFLGRMDHQVKIRGFRIELGEIESALNEHPLVSQAIAAVNEAVTGNKAIVAYIVQNEAGISDQTLSEFLSKKLPIYMVPSFFVFLNKMPLTPNGKIDRRALPTPDTSLRLMNHDYVPPSTQIEHQLAAIWSELLNVQTVGIYCNFFKLGGHSLLATQIVSRIRHHYHLDIPLRTLFENPTIAALSVVIELMDKKKNDPLAPSIAPRSKQTLIPLSFAQQRLWFLDKLLPEKAIYNIPIAIYIKGCLDIGFFEKAFNTVVQRHESLRTYFPVMEGKAFQSILPDLSFDIVNSYQNIGHLDKNEQALFIENLIHREAVTSFNLSIGPLVRIKLLLLSKEEHAVLITFHHIISDGWSLKIFFSELSSFYRTYVQGKDPSFPHLSIQYTDFVLWQRDWLQGKNLETQLAYWKRQLEGIPDLIELQTDRPRPNELSYQAASHQVSFNQELKARLNQLAQQQQVSLYMILLAVFQTFLHCYTGQEDIVVGSPIANRHYKETENVIGLFVNMLALRARFDPNITFIDFLDQIKETTLQAYQHQDVPFEKLVDHLNIERALNRNPIFQIVFTYQNILEEASLILEGASTKQIPFSHPFAKFDLAFHVFEDNHTIHLTIEYTKDILDTGTIERMGCIFKELIQNIVDNPQQSIGAFMKVGRQHQIALPSHFQNAMAPIPIIQETTGNESSISATIVKMLISIWSELLNLARVDIHDNFFKLGGDSILIIQLVSKSRKKGMIFTVKDVFKHPTIASLASVVEATPEAASLGPENQLKELLQRSHQSNSQEKGSSEFELINLDAIQDELKQILDDNWTLD